MPPPLEDHESSVAVAPLTLPTAVPPQPVTSGSDAG